eukprot:4127892-Amphidinium_carterae.1
MPQAAQPNIEVVPHTILANPELLNPLREGLYQQATPCGDCDGLSEALPGPCWAGSRDTPSVCTEEVEDEPAPTKR